MKKRSLKFKAAAVVVVFAVVLSLSTIIISATTFSTEFQRHYESLASSISKATATAIDESEVERLADMVDVEFKKAVEYYGGVPDISSFTEEERNEYYSRFDYIKETDEYKSLLSLLQKLRDDYGVKSLYLGFTDKDYMKDIYLVDASAPGEACLPGDFDEVEDEHIQLMENGQYDFPPYITNYSDYGWLCTDSTPIYGEDGSIKGLALVDISMNDIMGQIKEFIIQISVIVMLLTIIMVLFVIFIMNRAMIKPINLLSSAARRFISEENEGIGTRESAISKIEIKTGDEIENLFRSVKQMESDIYNYIENLTAVTAERERIGAELDVAKQIQTDMLPNTFPAFPEREEFDIYAIMTPAKEVGGDFYDFFLADDDHLVLVIADVSGKGVPAALFMMISKTLIKSAAQTGMSPKEILEKVNNQLCENNEAEMFVTAWVGIMEISTGRMICANAGHEFPAIKRANGKFELFRDKHGFVLAGMENMRYSEYEIELKAGDKLVVYTDGVTEAENESEELFGTERMIDSLNSAEERDCKDLLFTLKWSIDKFAGKAPQFDDITMLAIEMKGRRTKEFDVSEESAEKATEFVESILSENNIDKKTIYRMNIVVDEIYSNIVNYSGATHALISCDVSGGRIKLVFSDNGKKYDPLSVADPDITLDADERKPGGLGIFIVKKTADNVSYEYKDNRNILTVIKEINQ